MGKYILKRLLIMIPILLCVAVLVYSIINLVPGDPVTIAMGGGSATQAQIDAVRESMGLNKPFPVRLFEYVKNIVLHFDFGNSFVYGTPVAKELIARFPNSLKLAVFCVLLTFIIGVPIGIMSAIHANKAFDRISMFFTLIFSSMPGFWLALLLVLLFSVKLGWLPSSGIESWKGFILPVFCNGLVCVANIARQTRASMLEVIRSDYITTARSKGLSENAVIYEHALPNALIPIITVGGSLLAQTMGGALVTETVFSIPGLGSYLMTGINTRDYNVVAGSVICIAATFSVLMLLTDLLYAFIDPRIKALYMRKKGGIK